MRLAVINTKDQIYNHSYFIYHICVCLCAWIHACMCVFVYIVNNKTHMFIKISITSII